MQVNVRRSPSAHDLALVTAQENKVDILLVQEPWVFTDLSLRRSKTHPNFDAFSPLTFWHARPRVLPMCARTQNSSLSSQRIVSVLNIYNAPIGAEQAGDALTKLLSFRAPPYFVAGDFNLRHPLWDSTINTPKPACQELIDWYNAQNLHLLNPTESPTHNRGGTIDLDFCADNNAKCEVRIDLHITSNHETLITTIHRQIQRVGPGKLRYQHIDKEVFTHLLGRSGCPSPIRSRDELETEARELVTVIKTALTGACPRKRLQNRGTPWWNDECRQAAQAYHSARRIGHGIWERMELRTTVRRAKKAYWNSIISGAKSLSDAYEIVRWHNNLTKYQSPPLRSNDTSDLQYEPRAKALLLHKELLCKHLDTEDIQADTPTVAQRQIPWQKFSREEAYRATCKVSSTSPGDDEITAEILRLSWQVLGDRITHFFNCCIQFGTHPKVFKTAIIIILPKNGKRDRSQPKSYRPIALLSCLGK
ncbi:hypothetical protein EPUL_005489, partial [Erysiphe pulchra]